MRPFGLVVFVAGGFAVFVAAPAALTGLGLVVLGGLACATGLLIIAMGDMTAEIRRSNALLWKILAAQGETTDALLSRRQAAPEPPASGRREPSLGSPGPRGF